MKSRAQTRLFIWLPDHVNSFGRKSRWVPAKDGSGRTSNRPRYKAIRLLGPDGAPPKADVHFPSILSVPKPWYTIKEAILIVTYLQNASTPHLNWTENRWYRIGSETLRIRISVQCKMNQVARCAKVQLRCGVNLTTSSSL